MRKKNTPVDIEQLERRGEEEEKINVCNDFMDAHKRLAENGDSTRPTCAYYRTKDWRQHFRAFVSLASPFGMSPVDEWNRLHF